MSHVEIDLNPEENDDSQSACSAFVENGVRDCAMDPHLQLVIDRWDSLTHQQRNVVLAIVGP